MPSGLFKKGLNILLRRQTNILSAAFVLMLTVVFSQILGLIRQRMLVGIYGPSNTLGVYLASSRLPDLLFQVIIAGAISSSFIPIFADFLAQKKEEEGFKFASSLIIIGLLIFLFISVILFIFSGFFSHLVAPGFSAPDLVLMSNLTRIIILGEIIFMLASFFSAVLQCYNHFFITGIAAASYNLGIILGIIFLSKSFGIYAPAIGVIIGSFLFAILQVPFLRISGFKLKLNVDVKNFGVVQIFHLMWPRTISLATFQIGSLLTVSLISFLHDPGRSYVIFDYAQTLAFAPVGLIGQSLSQAAFPVLSRERVKLAEFKETFSTSFTQMLYLILPLSIVFIVLRIPLVRLIYGASQFDWAATVLTGRTLAIFSISLFAQSLIYLVSKAFYALHDTKTPLIVGIISTLFMLIGSFMSIFYFKGDIQAIAVFYTLSSFINFFILLICLDRKVGGFNNFFFIKNSWKIFLSAFALGLALYLPIKLLDQLVFDTTRTINLLMLTGISSLSGFLIYMFLTWFLNVKEASTFILLFKKIGNSKEILKNTEAVADPIRVKIN